MVTGSHIPFDRNGIKFNKSQGEVLKCDEAPILRAIAYIRRAEYERPAAESPFADNGMFRPSAVASLPPVNGDAEARYVRRYLDFFPPATLAGMRLVVYQHTAVGREILTRLLEGLGAEVHSLGLATEFVPIDTEAISAAQLATLQALATEASTHFGAIDAIVSTDGDSDRPLLVGVDPEGRPQFFGGDMLGIVVADYLGADAIAVPVTATDAIELHFADRIARSALVCRRTRVGSPWVIAAMSTLAGNHRVGWEANGGFLTFSDIERNGRRLGALPTRDAMLPIIAALHAAKQRRTSLQHLFAELPRRSSSSGLIDGVPSQASCALSERYAVADEGLAAAIFAGDDLVSPLDADGSRRAVPAAVADRLLWIRADLAHYFDTRRGFGAIIRLDLLDGIRITFDDGEIAHFRQSGNAPQMRIYTVAATKERAQATIALSVREPDGILRALLRESRSPQDG
jgi:phosphomannomutase